MNNSAYPSVAPYSLPRSLHHVTPDDALDDARDLAFLLRDVAFMQQHSTLDMEAPSQRGLELALGLLIDKLDIASGRYLFPLNGRTGTTENLAERTDGEQ